jgi:cobalt/nickel transport system permease protein
MHIPNEMLNGLVCPVSAALAVTGIAIAAHAARRAQEKPTALRFAAVAALVFAAQMINFPVQDGTSGHLLGGVVASSLLGVPFGVLALALVVAIQSLVFADGGLLVLGANVFNMALLGAGAGGLLNEALRKCGLHRHVALTLSACISVLLAATGCSLELAISGTIEAGKVLPAMLGVHALIGVGEALLTLVLVSAFSASAAKAGRWDFSAPFLGAILTATMLSPFASSHPDGLEWVAEHYGFLKEGAPLFVTPLADYAVPVIANGALSTALAGLIGVLLVAATGMLLGRLLQFRPAALTI